MWITVTDIDGVDRDVNLSLSTMISNMGDKSFLSTGSVIIAIHSTEHERIRKILGIKDEQ